MRQGIYIDGKRGIKGEDSEPSIIESVVAAKWFNF